MRQAQQNTTNKTSLATFTIPVFKHVDKSGIYFSLKLYCPNHLLFSIENFNWSSFSASLVNISGVNFTQKLLQVLLLKVYLS